MMLGFLLARAGVEVVVLEKHADFLRDFRGDTIHPSTLELMHELGILEDFLKRPHQEVREIAGQIGDDLIPIADFSHLPTHCKFIAFMPQWDFLDFISEHGARYPTFKVLKQAEFVHHFERRGMNRVAAKVAQKIRVLLKHHHVNPRPRQQVSEHYARRSTTGNAASRNQGLILVLHSLYRTCLDVVAAGNMSVILIAIY